MSLGFIGTKRSGKTSFQALEATLKENVFVDNIDGRKLSCVEAAATPNIDRSIWALHHAVDA